jgi:CheY-like chemotaxis protein
MEHKAIKVLLVESDARFARTMRESLTAQTTARIELVFSENLSEAMQRLEENRFDAIVLDLLLSDSQGLDTFARIHLRAPLLPIIVLADFDNETQALQAVRDGAQDYLVKAKAEGKLLSRSIRYAIERKRVEEALRESEQRYRRLLGSTTDYIYTVTLENGRAFRSAHGPGCVAVTGYSPNEYEADPNFFSRFEREDQIGQKLNHPFVLKFLPVDRRKSRPYIVTEYLRGCTLAHLLKPSCPLPEKDALKISSLTIRRIESEPERSELHGFGHAHSPICRQINSFSSLKYTRPSTTAGCAFFAFQPIGTYECRVDNGDVFVKMAGA